MNRDFPRIITLLRKERGLSQRRASDELGISQALLSHYEKGIRECGLDFLVKIADYYNVSCDYLLGRTPQRNGATISVDDIPQHSEDNDSDSAKSDMLSSLNKKLIINTTSVIFDTVTQMSSKKLTNSVSAYLMGANYTVFRKLYSSNDSNPKGMFSIPDNTCGGYCDAFMEISKTKIDLNLAGKKGKKSLNMSPESIRSDFPSEASSLFSLIQNTEKSIKGIG